MWRCYAAQVWVGEVHLQAVSRSRRHGALARLDFEARKAVCAAVGPRLFMERTPRLPCETPEGLRALRERELNIVKVTTHQCIDSPDPSTSLPGWPCAHHLECGLLPLRPTHSRVRICVLKR